MTLLTFISGGATCVRRQTIPEFAPPTVFSEKPTLAQVTAQVNRSLAIQRLASNTLTITSPDISAKLSGSMKWERWYNFSLEAFVGTRLMGTALAAGSNSEMFWLQTQHPSPPTLYYANHVEFENQTGPRRILPVSPLWLREALGIVEIDPNGQHEGPTLRPDGRLEVVSYIPSPRGAYRRVLVLAAQTGTIEQTILYNEAGKLVAMAQQSEHEYYTAVDWSLPHKASIQLHPDEGPPLAFTVEVGFYLINDENASSPSAFQLPDQTGLSTVDLVERNSAIQSSASPQPPVYRTDEASVQGLLQNYRLTR